MNRDRIEGHGKPSDEGVEHHECRLFDDDAELEERSRESHGLDDERVLREVDDVWLDLRSKSLAANPLRSCLDT